jgi:hypothetical protein
MEKTPTTERAAIASSDFLLAVLRAAEAAVPEGYRIAKDTLPERVKLMAEGLMAFMADREELRRENTIFRGTLEHIAHDGDDAQRRADDALSLANAIGEARADSATPPKPPTQ